MEPDRDSYDWYHAEYNAPSPIGTVLKWAVYAVLVFVFIGFAWAAFAQQQPKCGPAVEIERQLSGQYKETAHWIGRVADNTALFVLAQSPDGETWTIYIRRQDGMACLLAAGVKGEFVDAPKREPS